MVLVPAYDDPMDAVALDIVQGLYPERTAVGINCQNMLQWGGMVHCVTQQQPLGAEAMSVPANPQRQDHGKCIKRVDLMGREIRHPQRGQLFIKLFEDGWSEKVVEWE